MQKYFACYGRYAKYDKEEYKNYNNIGGAKVKAWEMWLWGYNVTTFQVQRIRMKWMMNELTWVHYSNDMQVTYFLTVFIQVKLVKLFVVALSS